MLCMAIFFAVDVFSLEAAVARRYPQPGQSRRGASARVLARKTANEGVQAKENGRARAWSYGYVRMHLG